MATSTSIYPNPVAINEPTTITIRWFPTIIAEVGIPITFVLEVKYPGVDNFVEHDRISGATNTVGEFIHDFSFTSSTAGTHELRIYVDYNSGQETFHAFVQPLVVEGIVNGNGEVWPYIVAGLAVAVSAGIIYYLVKKKK